MTIDNLPGVPVQKIDGNLIDPPVSRAPRAMVIGTASQGLGHAPYYVTTPSTAKSQFGSTGTLTRGMWEVLKSGAEEVVLYRIGSTPAILNHVGDDTGAAGYIITTIMEDDAAGGAYSMYYDDATDRLVIRRNSDYTVVFDNDSTTPIDLFEVTVSGARASTGGTDIGGPSSFVDLEDVTSLSSPPAGVTFTAGTDGTGMSRMELYEELYRAYKDILSEEFDVLVPMDVYLDDLNVVAQGSYIGAVTPVLPGVNTYPTAGAYSLGSDVDSLGKVYVEEYEGQYYFWWDINGDGTAELFPTGVGSADATTGITGTSLTTANFHEVNFAYQLSRFLYDYSTDIVDASGVIGCLPPNSANVVDRARWLGKSPTWTLNNTTGIYYIASAGDNGSGLLGNKFMVGRNDHRSGIYGGGFILTDTEFMDGSEQVDNNDIPIDLGKFISVVADSVFMQNNYDASGYISTYAPSYGGFYIGLAPASAPTNKVISSSIRVVYRQALKKLDNLAGAGYVTLRRKEKGLTVADSPTATMPNSDWRRLSTCRIVKAIIDAVRRVADPYLGEGFAPTNKVALKEDIEKVLVKAKKDNYLVSYKEFDLIQTPSMAVNGRASVKLVLRPAFELRHLDVTVSLTK